MALAENSATFEANCSHGFLTVEGNAKVDGSLIKGKDGTSSGIFEVNLKDLDTGIEIRNNIMREKHLEVQKYPTATLVLNPVTVLSQGYFNWTGDLTLHGVTNKISGVAFVDEKEIEAKFSINILDYKITKASSAGVGLDDKINIIVHISNNIRPAINYDSTTQYGNNSCAACHLDSIGGGTDAQYERQPCLGCGASIRCAGWSMRQAFN
jgi:hypothetical protein